MKWKSFASTLLFTCCVWPEEIWERGMVVRPHNTQDQCCIGGCAVHVINIGHISHGTDVGPLYVDIHGLASIERWIWRSTGWCHIYGRVNNKNPVHSLWLHLVDICWQAGEVLGAQCEIFVAIHIIYICILDIQWYSMGKCTINCRHDVGGVLIPPSA